MSTVVLCMHGHARSHSSLAALPHACGPSDVFGQNSSSWTGSAALVGVDEPGSAESARVRRAWAQIGRAHV